MSDPSKKLWEQAFGPTARIAPASARPPLQIKELELKVLEGPDKGKSFRLQGAVIRIGKDSDNEVVLADLTVSRHHFAIEDQPQGYLLKDAGSTNGTRVDGTLVKEAFLAPGATIVLGQTTLRFQPRTESFQVLPSSKKSFGGLVGHSLPMRELFGFLERVAATDLSVVLLGETGTGKEVVARAIHDASRRKAAPLVVFDCGATEENLVGAALFGHREGAFTGATHARKGAFQAAAGGTLFIDEVGEMPLDLQPKLLRALERREVIPLGMDAPVRVDLRVICATHRPLPAQVAAGKFREDLFYRLSGLVLEIPPLRARREDILPLAQHFLSGTGREVTLDDSARAVLESHDWPGNVRELKNVIERAAALVETPTLKGSDLMLGSARPGHAGMGAGASAAPGTVDRKSPRSLEEVEKEAIEAALTATQWNKTEASRILGITTKTLREKIERYGIRRP